MIGKIPLLLGALLVQGCTTAPSEEGAVVEVEAVVEAPVLVKRPRPEDYPVAHFEKETLYQLLVAEIAGYRGQYDLALEKYVAMAIQSRDPGVAARATRLAVYLKKNQSALQTSLIWAEEAPDSLDAHRHAAEQLMKVNNLEAAIVHMEAVKRLGGLANFEVFAYRATNMDGESRRALLEAVSRMFVEYPEDEQLMFAKAVLLEQDHQFEEALVLSNQLMASRKNINVIILKVNVLKGLGRLEDAVGFLQGAVESQPGNRRLRLIFARFLFETDQLDKARVQYEQILAQSPEDGDILFALALIAMEQQRDEVAVRYLSQMIRWNRRASEAHYYLGTIAEKNKNAPLAIREYRQVTAGYEFLPAQAKIATMMIDQGRVRETSEYLQRIRAEIPELTVQLILLEAQLLSERGFQDEVFVLLDQAIAADSNNIQLLYFRAMTGEKYNRLDILEQDLRAVIALEPNNADALNALGYTLTDQTERHQEARVLIERALQIKPNEAAYIDSMGWVLYQLEDFDAATGYLRRALELFPNDEVAAHLGAALWMSGEQAEAQLVWEKALELAPDSKILDQVIKRFSE